MAEEIVERIKAEGQLTRNTGTNSIRAVRIQMDRFESIFETISEQVSMQTQFLADMVETSMDQLKIDGETAERERARQDREDLAEDQEEAGKDSTNSASKNISLSSLIPNDGSGFLNTLLKGALFAGGVFALGNIFKGFIESRIGESEFTEGLVSAVSWTAIGSIFGKKFGLLLGAGNLLSNALGLPSVVEKIGDALNLELEENDLLTQGIATSLAAAFLMQGGLKTKLIGGIIILTNLLGDKAKNWLVEQGNVDPDIANVAVDAASFAVQGAALGSLFGLPGMLAGAVAGLALSLGLSALSWFDRQKAEAEAQLRRDLAEAETILQDEEKRAEIQSVVDTLKTMTPEQQNAFVEERGGLTRPEQLAFDRVATPEDYDTEEITYNLSEIKRLNQMGAPVDASYINNLRDAGYNLDNLEADTGYAMPEYAKGTKGFQDFGPASFAILHGKEAVVPKETPAGRFLEQFFDKDWSPKMSGASGVAEQVSAVASGGINMPVIVHNSPTVAPIINNVQGGANISTTSVYGSGGGDRSRNTYGLTNSAN